MIISERDFAAQYQISGKNTLKFDDLGCMFHYMNDEHHTDISSIFVIDYDSKQWIDGRSAFYVWTETIKTPMGYGVLAFKESQEAKKFADKENGKYLDSLTNTSEIVLKSKNHHPN